LECGFEAGFLSRGLLSGGAGVLRRGLLFEAAGFCSRQQVCAESLMQVAGHPCIVGRWVSTLCSRSPQEYSFEFRSGTRFGED
jgi:hypothetical protein